MMRFALALAVVGCGSGSTGAGASDAGHRDGDPIDIDGPRDGGLVPGNLTVAWIHGSASCNQNADPELQMHAYNDTTIIFRQNKCDTFEAPFVYLLIGTTKALLLDTGDLGTTTLRDAVLPIVAGKPLLVAHTHAHGDHTAGDATFANQPNVTVVAKNQQAIQDAFGIATWPTSQGSYDLGDRVLDVLAIPGHEAQHIAIYDRQTGVVLTGDTLYPGLLFINDWTAYRASVSRLADFVAVHTISWVLGAHIEMTSTPKQNYPYGTTYQPAEHVLQLTAAHVAELDSALDALGPDTPTSSIAHDDFVIDPQ